jgi:hypothetical protein
VRWLMAFIIVTALPPKPVTHPGFVDAAQLAAACDADGPRAAEMRAVCLGYVTGVTDQLLARTAGRRPPTICPPAGFTPGDAVAAVQRHARFASTAQGIGAADFVRFALERACPCPVERSLR